ncbi:nucleotide-diphospho-sugar transferase, partial [Dioszegia hungarica]
TSKEAYVLSLPSVEREEYLLALRVLLYGYKYDHYTRDPSRDVIVMTTPHVPVEVEDQLRADGAIIFRHDLIPSITDPFDINSDHICRHCYNKLLVWNMIQYERVLLADSDFLMVRSLEGIWDEPESQAETGLAARSVLHSDPGTDYLDSSFVIARPNRTMFEELLLVQGSPGPMQDIGQSLLDKYFRKDGPHPWSALDEKLHEKCWMDSGDWALTSLWSMKVGKMLGHQLA